MKFTKEYSVSNLPFRRGLRYKDVNDRNRVHTPFSVLEHHVRNMSGLKRWKTGSELNMDNLIPYLMEHDFQYAFNSRREKAMTIIKADYEHDEEYKVVDLFIGIEVKTRGCAPEQYYVRNFLEKDVFEIDAEMSKRTRTGNEQECVQDVVARLLLLNIRAEIEELVVANKYRIVEGMALSFGDAAPYDGWSTMIEPKPDLNAIAEMMLRDCEEEQRQLREQLGIDFDQKPSLNDIAESMLRDVEEAKRQKAEAEKEERNLADSDFEIIDAEEESSLIDDDVTLGDNAEHVKNTTGDMENDNDADTSCGSANKGLRLVACRHDMACKDESYVDEKDLDSISDATVFSKRFDFSGKRSYVATDHDYGSRLLTSQETCDALLLRFPHHYHEVDPDVPWYDIFRRILEKPDCARKKRLRLSTEDYGKVLLRKRLVRVHYPNGASVEKYHDDPDYSMKGYICYWISLGKKVQWVRITPNNLQSYCYNVGKTRLSGYESYTAFVIAIDYLSSDEVETVYNNIQYNEKRRTRKRKGESMFFIYMPFLINSDHVFWPLRKLSKDIWPIQLVHNKRLVYLPYKVVIYGDPRWGNTIDPLWKTIKRKRPLSNKNSKGYFDLCTIARNLDPFDNKGADVKIFTRLSLE